MNTFSSPEKNPSPTYKCPKCGDSKFKRWEFPHPFILFWVLTPVLTFNEIVLGQRIPKTQLICKVCNVPEMDRAFVPCPSCKTMHLGRLAGGKRGFGNWRGIRCPLCNKPIPCIWNIFSLAILALSFPLWALPYFLYFKKQPLPPLFFLENGQIPTPKKITKKSWIFIGAAWGVSVWIIMNFLPFFTHGELPSWNAMLDQIPIYVLASFTFGFFMWFFLGRTPNKKNKANEATS